MTCESGYAYLHANYMTRRGEKSGKRPPCARQREGEGRKDIADTRGETRGTSDRANGQTNEKESKGAVVDEMGN